MKVHWLYEKICPSEQKSLRTWHARFNYMPFYMPKVRCPNKSCCCDGAVTTVARAPSLLGGCAIPSHHCVRFLYTKKKKKEKKCSDVLAWPIILIMAVFDVDRLLHFTFIVFLTYRTSVSGTSWEDREGQVCVCVSVVRGEASACQVEGDKMSLFLISSLRLCFRRCSSQLPVGSWGGRIESGCSQIVRNCGGVINKGTNNEANK